MPWCPVCRDEFRAGFTMCPDHDVALVDELPPDPEEMVTSSGEPIVGERLGWFGVFEAPILVDLLLAGGIEANLAPSPAAFRREARPTRSEVYVDASRFADAQRIAREELPRRLAELEGSAAVEFAEPQADPWAQPVMPDDMGPTVTIGWMDASVAREFVSLCAETGIGVETEYPLDRPAPQWAREDGRVRVHVEALMLDDATELLETELADRLAEKGIADIEPLLEPDD